MLATIEISPHFSGHELVTLFHDAQTGLQGFFAIHSTRRGSALGGTRYLRYASAQSALSDALRLSKAMTYKCALAGVPHGGGKGIILADDAQPKSRGMLVAYARRLNLLGGNFYTGEDVGLTMNDIEVLASISPYVLGRKYTGRSSGAWTALGVFYAITAALEAVFGSPRIAGRTFAVKGLGKVGRALCVFLARQGGVVWGADVSAAAVETAKTLCPSLVTASPDEISSLPVDVYAPCALGNEFDVHNIERLQCRAICGAANNQLATPEADRLLFERGILYVPDYVANAGGIIRVADELQPLGHDEGRVRDKIKNISKTAQNVIELSREHTRPTAATADDLACAILEKTL